MPTATLGQPTNCTAGHPSNCRRTLLPGTVVPSASFSRGASSGMSMPSIHASTKRASVSGMTTQIDVPGLRYAPSVAETLRTMPSRGATTACCAVLPSWMSTIAMSRSAVATSLSALRRLALMPDTIASYSRPVRSSTALAAARLARELSSASFESS